MTFNKIDKKESVFSSEAAGVKEVYLSSDGLVELVLGDPLKVVSMCNAAVCTSGTVTLECALMGVPQIVVYKTHPLSYLIAKKLITLPYISLPNLIADKEIIPEFIQNFSHDEMAAKIMGLLRKDPSYHQMNNDYAMMKGKLKPDGPKNVIQSLINHNLIDFK